MFSTYYRGMAMGPSFSWRLSMPWTVTPSVDGEDCLREGRKYTSTKTAYPIRIEIEGRHVLSHVFRICTDYGSTNSRERLLKYIEHLWRKTMTWGTRIKWKRCSFFVLSQDLFQHYHICPLLTFLVQFHPIASHYWRVKKVCKVADKTSIDWKGGFTLSMSCTCKYVITI